MRRRLAVTLTGKGGTLLLQGGRILNVFSGEVYPADVLIADHQIAAVGEPCADAEQVIDCTAKIILPGFIDGHIHIESSMLHPFELCHLLSRHGTTTIVADPHEITNILGAAGVDFMLNATVDTPVDVFLMVPSCVPATEMESAGARLGLREVRKLLNRTRVLGLAEFMNFPAVISGNRESLTKIQRTLAMGKLVDGHAPGLRGKALQTYFAAGVRSDHESTGRDEAREKLRIGMHLMIREGSAAHNLAGLASVVTPSNSRRCFFVTDDCHPSDLLSDGHMDSVLRKAVAHGIDPITAVQMVTLNPAEYFGLKDRGAIAPGYLADLTVVRDLEQFQVIHVIKAGRLLSPAHGSKCRWSATSPAVFKTMNLARFTISSLAMPVAGRRVRVIRLLPGQIITEVWITEPKIEKGHVVSDTERDILKLAIIERHRRTGRVGLGLLNGLQLKKGALASSVAHDSHNLIVVGTNDRDMTVAVQRLVRLGGGFVAAADGRVAAEVSLPVAGLMSLEPAPRVAKQLTTIGRVVHNWGVRLANPFAALSFLALPVIPQLKLTDQGLVDVNQFKIVSLWVTD